MQLSFCIGSYRVTINMPAPRWKPETEIILHQRWSMAPIYPSSELAIVGGDIHVVL